jgi:hypothetical protein
MSQANVRSLDAMRAFRVRLLEFAGIAIDVTASLQQQTISFLDWVEHDRPNFWKQYMLRSFDVIAQARADLEKCKMRTVGDHRPTCYEEKLALTAAKQRLQMAQEKVEACARWCSLVRHEIDEFDGRRGSLQRYIESDFAKTIATLERMILAIEAYAEIESAAEEPIAPPPPAV